MFGGYPSPTVTKYDADGVPVTDSNRFVNVLVATLPIEPLDFRKRAGGEAGFVPQNLKWNVQVGQIVTQWLNLRANLTGSPTDNIYIVNPEPDFRGRTGIVLPSPGPSTLRALDLTAQ